MRRTKEKLVIQKPLYLAVIDGWKTIYNSTVNGYYKNKKDYNIILCANGAIIGKAKTVKECEKFISEFDKNISNINLSKEFESAKTKPFYDEWISIPEKIEEEIGIDISFAVREDNIDLKLLEIYLSDNSDFLDCINSGVALSDSIKEIFGMEVYALIDKFIGGLWNE